MGQRILCCGPRKKIRFPACVASFCDFRTVWMGLILPLAVLPWPLLYPSGVTKCGYCVVVTGFFWVTEIIPLPVTSLFPVFLFPMFGIMTAKEVCRSYVKDTLMLFLGSLVVAVAVERWNLHRRLALRTLTLVGPHPRWLMLGVMFPCWFLSMWMSNTATTAMMMPIVVAILDQIRESKQNVRPLSDDTDDEHEVKIVMEDVSKLNGDKKDDIEIIAKNRAVDEKDDAEFLALAKVFALATAFSANIGGMATLTGTPPNVIFKGLSDSLYSAYGETNPINFASWLILGFPLSFACFIVLWFWMQLYGQGVKCFKCFSKDNSFDAVKQKLASEYRKLGSMTFAEAEVLISFICLALLWVTRNPGFIPGWSNLFEKGHVGDSTPAILISALLFILPARPPRWLICCPSKTRSIKASLEPWPTYEPILTWKVVNERMAWGVLLLMGGGFALADGCQVSGLSAWVGGHLEAMGSMSIVVVAFLLSLFINLATEVTSNAATTTLFVPIAGELAVQLGVNPLYFMIPCTIAASFAFLLPVATPPNAIVFAGGYLKVRDMVLVGIPINVFSILALNVACNTWGASAYNLWEVPPNFRLNVTSISSALNATALNTTLPMAVDVMLLNSTVLP